MNTPTIREKIHFYRIQIDMWKRRINPHNYPGFFKFFRLIKTPKIVCSLAIFTIFLMLYTISIKIDYLTPTIIPFNEIKQIQAHLLSASSIIVSLLIAFVISKYFDVQRYRTSELNKFIRLQNRLVLYQRAFYHLGDQLERKYQLKPKYFLDHNKALRDYEYSNNPANRAEKPDACIFTSALREFGFQSSNFEDFDLNRKIMSKSYLNKLKSCLSYLWGVLDRQKYYKYILEDLSIDESLRHSSKFSMIKIAENTLFVKEVAMLISPKTEKENWENLEFWNNRINEANTILDKMLKLSNYLHDYKANLIRSLLRPLVIISVFGIILPLLLLSVQFNEEFEYYLTYFSIVGFLLFFILIIGYIYSELTSTDFQRL